MMDLAQYRMIVEYSPNMIWRSNQSTEFDYFNKTWLDFTGSTLEEEYGFGWAKRIHPEDYESCVKTFHDHVAGQQAFEMVFRLKRHDEQYRLISMEAVPYYDEAETFLGYIGSSRDITESKRAQQYKPLKQKGAMHQTHSRQYTHTLMDEVFHQARMGAFSLCLLMMDIDDFTAINDTYSHKAGDEVLAQVAAITKSQIRSFDILERFGNDEFLVGLIQTNLEVSLRVAARIQQAIAKTDIEVMPDTKLQVSVSIGVTSLQNEMTLEELMQSAEKKLYEAKAEGKGSIMG